MIDRLATAVRRITPAARVSIAIAITVNVVLAGAWFWSRPGMTTRARLEASGDGFTEWLDGRQQGAATFSAPLTGHVELTIEDSDEVPSLPAPRGLERVAVTDLDTGETLFDERFDRLPIPGVEIVTRGPGISGGANSVDIDGGVLAAHGGIAVVRFGDDSWRDYAVDVTYRNMTTGIIRVRASADGSGVEFGFRPFRHLDNRLTLFDKGRAVTNQLNAPIEASGREEIRSMTRMLLRPYPYVLALLVIALAGVLVLSALPVVDGQPPIKPPAVVDALFRTGPGLAAAALALTAFGITLFLNYDYGSAMPHVPDEISYLFQAKVFAAGHLTAPPPKVVESFQLGNPPLIVINDGKWASLYPFAHPLALAVGARIGAVWLIPPLLGGASVALVFAIGRRIGNARTGLLAATLFGASPFFMMTASNFMSHNTAAFFLLASVLLIALSQDAGADETSGTAGERRAFLSRALRGGRWGLTRGWLRRERRAVVYPLIAGVSFGLLLNTRQLSAIALAPPFGLLLLTPLIRGGRPWLTLRQTAAFALGAGVLALLYFAYKYATTGDPFTVEKIQGGENVIGFGGLHSVRAGIENEQTQLAFLLLVLDNWPLWLGLGLALLPFALGTRSRWDWFFLAATVSAWGVYTLYYTNGLMHGPRYWYEPAPLLMLMMARGADRAALLLADAACWIRARASAPSVRRRWAGVAVVYGLVLAFAIPASNDWLRGDGGDFIADTVPHNARELRGFNGVDDRVVTRVRAAGPKNALVLTDACPGWQCYGNVSWLNSPWLDGDVIYARDLPAENAELFAAFPDRVVYRSRYYLAPPAFAPYDDSTTDVTKVSASATPPRAGAIPTPTIAPTPTPDFAAAERRDDERRAALAASAGLLERYYRDRGSYPPSRDVQSFCVYENDAACALKDYADPLPRDPSPGGLFWYQSDGQSYRLFASLENAAPQSACPDPIPPHLASVQHLYCVFAGPPPP